jgi:hypothetical protein
MKGCTGESPSFMSVEDVKLRLKVAGQSLHLPRLGKNNDTN